jgi:hypothetical protein
VIRFPIPPMESGVIVEFDGDNGPSLETTISQYEACTRLGVQIIAELNFGVESNKNVHTLSVSNTSVL